MNITNEGRADARHTAASRAALLGIVFLLRRIPGWVWALATMWIGWALAGGI